MVNGVDLVGFFITFCGGFLVGLIFGVMIMAMAAASGRDSRQREEMEEKDKNDE